MLYNVYKDNPPIKEIPKKAGIKNAYWYGGKRECIQFAKKIFTFSLNLGVKKTRELTLIYQNERKHGHPKDVIGQNCKTNHKNYLSCQWIWCHVFLNVFKVKIIKKNIIYYIQIKSYLFSGRHCTKPAWSYFIVKFLNSTILLW